MTNHKNIPPKHKTKHNGYTYNDLTSITQTQKHISVVSDSVKRNMENVSEYETILNYVTRGEYPAGATKEQKRAIRRKVEVRSSNSNNTNSNKFVAKDGVL